MLETKRVQFFLTHSVSSTSRGAMMLCCRSWWTITGNVAGEWCKTYTMPTDVLYCSADNRTVNLVSDVLRRPLGRLSSRVYTGTHVAGRTQVVSTCCRRHVSSCIGDKIVTSFVARLLLDAKGYKSTVTYE